MGTIIVKKKLPATLQTDAVTIIFADIKLGSCVIEAPRLAQVIYIRCSGIPLPLPGITVNLIECMFKTKTNLPLNYMADYLSDRTLTRAYFESKDK